MQVVNTVNSYRSSIGVDIEKVRMILLEGFVEQPVSNCFVGSFFVLVHVGSLKKEQI